ncbi:hypothetical protein H4R33_000722 [Dimargaris cristalligena]|nr:hypothetical protein H4R33_000722 [Dimargaris cristalligena]
MSFQPFGLQPLLVRPASEQPSTSQALSNPASPQVSHNRLPSGTDPSPPASSSPNTRTSRLLNEVAARSTLRRHSSATNPGPSPPGGASYPSGPGFDCADGWESNLYVGAGQGQVHHYWIDHIRFRDADPTPPSFIQTVTLGSGKGRVESITVVPTLRKVMVLCEATLWFLSFPDLTPLTISQFAPIRGVMSFALNTALRRTTSLSDPVPALLYVARRRTIQILQLSSQGLQPRQDVPFPAGATQLCAWNEQVCLSDHHSYALLNIRNPRPPLELAPTSLPRTPSARPLILAITPDEFFLVTGTGVDFAALGMFITTGGDAVRGTLHFPQFPIAITYQFPYLLVLTPEFQVEVYDITRLAQVQTVAVPPGVVWQLTPAAYLQISFPAFGNEPTPTTLPVPFLLVGPQAIYSVFMPPLSYQIEALLDAQKVDVALEHVNRALTAYHYHTPTLSDELQYINRRIALIYFSQQRWSDALEYFRKGRIPPALVLGLLPELAAHLPDFSYEPSPALDAAYSRIRNRNPESASTTTSPDADSDTRPPVSAAERTAIRYFQLVKEDSRVAPDIWTPLDLQVVNSVLLRHYLEDQSDKIYSILKDGGSYCHLAMSESLLTTHDKPFALSMLYRAHQLPEKVLAIWSNILIGKPSNDRFGGLDEFFAYLDGFRRSDLVWSFSDIVLERSEILGAQLFVSIADQDTSQATIDRIVDHLHKHGSAGAILYLDHVIRQLNCRESHQHDRLLDLLIEQLHARTGAAGPTALHELLQDFQQTPERTEGLTFVEFLETHLAHSPLARVRTQLLRFLAWSDVYDLNKFRDVMAEQTELVPELALIEGKLGHPKQVLPLLVLQVQDYAAAEVYGATIVATLDRNDYFRSLLKYYLKLEDEDTAVILVNQLLTRHGEALDALQVLNLLPTTWPIDALESFLTDALRQTEHRRRHNQVIKALHTNTNLTVHNQYAQLQNSLGPNVVVTSESHCTHCLGILDPRHFLYLPKTKALYHPDCYST